MKQLKSCQLIFLMLCIASASIAQSNIGGYAKLSYGLGYRIAKTDESVNLIPGLNDIVSKQRSGGTLHFDAGFFLGKDKKHSLGAVFNRFSSTASGTIGFPGIGNTMITSKEAINFFGLLYGNHIYFGGNDKSCAVLKAGLGYNNYSSETTSPLVPGTKLSAGNIGFIVGGDLDFKLVKSLYFSAGLNLISGSVNVESEGETAKENLSMFTATGGLKFRF
jgi:hypothetical protein